MAHVASRESPNSTDVVDSDPTVVPSWDARDVSGRAASYQNIAQLNGGIYLHDVVVHQHNFVAPLHPDVHTQNTDLLWMRAERKLYGRSAETGPSSARTWRSSCGRSATRTRNAA